MKLLRAAVLAGVLVALALPEVLRYAAERRLARANAAFDLVLTRPTQVESVIGLLEAITEAAVTTAPIFPGDSRAWVLAGSAQLVARNAERALNCYREAFRLGERAEIHLNYGRAAALSRRMSAADAAFLRALWISPALLRAVPPGFAERAAAGVALLEAELAAGRLAAPPPMPD